jgi:hypothetical protein
MEDLLARVTAIAQAFGRAEIPHSFGGAIALGYYASARPTRDIDINVYLRVDDAGRALDSMGERLNVQYVLDWVERTVGTDSAPARRLIHALAERSLLLERRTRRDGPPAR